MSTFRILADATFEADNIDKALAFVADYFVRMASGQNPQIMLVSGGIDIRPAEVRTPVSIEHGLRSSLQLAVRALNKAPRFAVPGEAPELNDSYKIAHFIGETLKR